MLLKWTLHCVTLVLRRSQAYRRIRLKGAGPLFTQYHWLHLTCQCVDIPVAPGLCMRRKNRMASRYRNTHMKGKKCRVIYILKNPRWEITPKLYTNWPAATDWVWGCIKCNVTYERLSLRFSLKLKTIMLR